MENDRETLDAALKQLDEAADSLDLFKPGDAREVGVPVVELRRRGRRPVVADSFGAISLIEEEGVLRWEEGMMMASLAGPGGRRMRRGGGPTGEIVRQFKFEKLEPNKVGEMLVNLDQRLTPNQGLHRAQLVKDDRGGKKVRLEPIERPAAKKRALLLIHGTFSNTENLFAGIEATEAGRAFLSRVIESGDSPYDELLAFNHPTLSVGPMMNAVDLARLFGDCPATIDVICHSRGGLVTRWWLEGVRGSGAAPGKVVAVASPLGGTSFASPGRLKASLNFITNVGRVLETVGGIAAGGAPFMTVAVGLVKVITSITGWSSSLPLIDAAVSMIPGLAAQSRTNNNLELARLLRSHNHAVPQYYSVLSNFVPEATGWKFWKLFVNPKDRVMNLGADLVFQQENDLVVDTRSMTELFKDGETVQRRVEKTFDFGDQPRVHHTNYFQQEETIKFIRESLGVS